MALPASAATRTWSGAGSDSNFSTAANWGGTAPVAGDDLVFPAGPTNLSPNNNLSSGTSLNTITFSGGGYALSGNGINLVAGITNTSAAGLNTIGFSITLTASQSFVDNSTSGTGALEIGTGFSSAIVALGSNTLTLTAVATGEVVVWHNLTGTGAITSPGAGFVGIFGSNSGYSGAINANAGIFGVEAGTVGSGTITVASGAQLMVFSANTGDTISNPIVLNGSLDVNGGGSGGVGSLAVPITPTGGGVPGTSGFILSGNITLGSGAHVFTSDGGLSLTGVISGAGGITFNPTVASAELQLTNTNTYTGATSTSGKLTVDGAQGSSNVTVTNGGSLFGHGTVGTVTTQSGGSLAPGNSPGCIVSGNLTLVSGSNYNAELAGTTVCTQYDQTQVTGTVDLGGATLNLTVSFTPTSGNTFTIISNDASDAVTGTFAGLAEGATVTAGGQQFTISYVGGDGNDVVLTWVRAVPGLPATGGRPAHPGLVLELLAGAMALGAAYFTAQRLIRG